jgi:hypothetical protein
MNVTRKKPSKNEISGMILKGIVSGKEKWIFVSFSEGVPPIQRDKVVAFGYALRRQAKGGGIRLKFNQLPEEPVVVKNTEITTRILTGDEIVEFFNAFQSAKSRPSVDRQQKSFLQQYHDTGCHLAV